LSPPTQEDITEIKEEIAGHDARIENLEDYERIQNGAALRLESKFEKFMDKFDGFKTRTYWGIITILAGVLAGLVVLAVG